MYGLAFNKLHVCQHWKAMDTKPVHEIKKHVKNKC